MKDIEKNLLKIVKNVSKDRAIDPGLPARCLSFFHQPKRPVRSK
ncbi:MAG: cyclic lactone autoinducer peptide [Clostridiales bacterium]|nr:cyclic lactone autoinducer peptide [Clostridiales bacterium]